MFLWLFLSLTALVCACAAVWAQGSRARRLLAALPTYPQLPLFGNILYFIGGSEHIFMRIIDMTQKSEEKNLPFVLWIGPLPALLVHDPEDVKIISNVFVEKPYLYSFAREWVGDGLVTAAGPIWKKNIKKLAGTFTASIVDGYQDVFNAQAQNLVQRLKTKAGSEPFDAMHDLAYTTLEAICQTALGTPKITSRIVTEEYYQAFNKTLQLLMSRGVNIFYHPEWVYHKTSAYRELKKSVAILHNVSETVLTQRKKERSEKAAQCENQKCNGYEDTGKSKCKTLIDILLDLSEEDPTLTEKQIKSELDTIIVGGQETVATTLFFTLLMIGCKKDIQEKLHKEISSIFGDSKRPIQKEDLDAMRYCEATIMETLRLFPPIPVVMRHADRDLVLKSYTIPKGAGCGINALGAGRSKRNWGPDAEVYNPERWLDQTTQGATFLPFSYGRRACIGKKYALQILKTILASCVRELEFKSNADQLKFKYDLVIRPTSGHLMQVSCRDDQRPATFIMSTNPFLSDEEGVSQTPASCSMSKKNDTSRGKKDTKPRQSKPKKKAEVVKATAQSLFGSDCDSDPGELSAPPPPPTPLSPPVKKRKLPLIDSEDEEETFRAPIRAAALRSYLSRRTGSGYTLQSDPTRHGDFFIELRVYNTKEIETLQKDRWKQALVTLRTASNEGSKTFKAVTQLVVAAKEEYERIQPVLYPSNFNVF